MKKMYAPLILLLLVQTAASANFLKWLHQQAKNIHARFTPSPEELAFKEWEDGMVQYYIDKDIGPIIDKHEEIKKQLTKVTPESPEEKMLKKKANKLAGWRWDLVIMES